MNTPLPGNQNVHSTANKNVLDTHSINALSPPNVLPINNQHINHSPTNENFIETNLVKIPNEIKSPTFIENSSPPSIQSFPTLPSIHLTAPFLGISSTSSSGSVHNDNINEPHHTPIRSFPTLPPSFLNQTPPPPASAPVQQFPTLSQNSFLNEPPTPAEAPIQPPIHSSIPNEYSVTTGDDGSPILYIDSNGIFQIQNPNNNDVHTNLNKNNEISVINNDSSSINNINNNRKKDSSAIIFNDNEHIGINERMNDSDENHRIGDDNTGFDTAKIDQHNDDKRTSAKSSESNSNENDSESNENDSHDRSRIEPRFYNGLPVFN